MGGGGAAGAVGGVGQGSPTCFRALEWIPARRRLTVVRFATEFGTRFRSTSHRRRSWMQS